MFAASVNLLTIGLSVLVPISYAYTIDLYSNTGCGLYADSLQPPSEIGCTSFPSGYSVESVRVNGAADGCTLGFYTDMSCNDQAIFEIGGDDGDNGVCADANGNANPLLTYTVDGC